MRMTTPDHTKWIVAICSKVFPKDQVGRCDIVQLQDPSTGELRQYIVVPNKDQSQIVEIQSLEADFSSFFVGRHVIKDGNLYVLNVVDPLFFLLHGCSTSSPNKQSTSSWQPFDQTLDRFVSDKTVRDCVVQSQMGHLFDTLCTDQTDNVTYYKFAEAKALVWLQKKQERVYQCLLSQEKGRRQRRQALLARRPQGSNASGNGVGGSVSATFYMPEDPMAAPVVQNKNDEEISLTTLQKLRMESLQIVCNYLSEEWTEKFLKYVGVTVDEVFAPAQAKSVAQTTTTTVAPGTESTLMTTPAKVTPKPVRVEPARSIANKRLEKVNKRGMSALTSFFGPPKKKVANSKD